MAFKCALDFRGFPVNVALHPQKKSTRGVSFKMVGPDGQPPVGKSFEASTGRELSKDDIGRAVSIGRGKAAVLHPLTSEAVETITSQAATKVMEADSFAPIESIPFELALMSYTVVPDPDVAGAERSASVIWNGLRGTGLAYVCQATVSSRDSMIAIWATETELKAVSLPFVAEMYPAVHYDWTVNEDQAAAFKAAVGEAYDVRPFELGAYSSEYEARRQEVIDQVLAGQQVAAPEVPEPKAETPDLMAMLAGMAGEKKPVKKPAKTTKKVTA
jgi:non-homologous end joining protein Ku